MDIARAKAKGKLDMQAWRTTRADKKPESYAKVIKYNWENRAYYIPQRGTEINKHNTATARAEWSTKAIWSIEAQQERETNRQSTTEAQKWQLAARRATQHTATVSRKELITEYLTELARSQKWTPITYAECEDRLAEQIKQGNLIQTQEERITSWEMITADRKAVEPNNQYSIPNTVLTEHDVSRQLNNYQEQQETTGKKKLSDIQKQAVKEILIQTNPVTVVQGDAGSGKTTALRAVNEICKNQNIKVIGLAIQGIAARNLEAESGIKSQTLTSYLSLDTRQSQYFS
jgi:ATP-dependent exoDNAse (exonuclease V) alpha subunit